MPPRRQRSERGVFEAKQTFFAVLDGVETRIGKDERVREGHDLLTTHADFFRPLTVRFDVPEAEQATAAPGERR